MTKLQERQLDFCDGMEPYEKLTNLHTYEVTCRECDDTITCHSVSTVKTFIYQHEGHHTWINLY